MQSKDRLSKGQRRLASILYTDMVGYTTLGQSNESISLAFLDEQRNLVRPILKSHHGREVKKMGDAGVDTK
jgi:class 3 adenylate cyclase